MSERTARVLCLLYKLCYNNFFHGKICQEREKEMRCRMSSCDHVALQSAFQSVTRYYLVSELGICPYMTNIL
jgi:hypothetical protein